MKEWRLFCAKATAVLAIVAIFLSTTTPIALAQWYAGNWMSPAYGIQGTISTPSSLPYVPSDGTAVFIDVGDGSGWVQTGWERYWDQGELHYYVEMGYNYNRQHYHEPGVAPLGSYAPYKITYSGGTWWVYTNGKFEGGFGGDSLGAPKVLIGEGETHTSSTTMGPSYFSSLRYQASQGSGWTLWSENHHWADPPYHKTVYSAHNYKVYGP